MFLQKRIKEKPIDVFEAYSDVEEGEIVVNKIIELRRKNDCEYNDFAILYRTNAQSRILKKLYGNVVYLIKFMEVCLFISVKRLKM